VRTGPWEPVGLWTATWECRPAATFVRRWIDFKWAAGRLAAPLHISPTIELQVPSIRPPDSFSCTAALCVCVGCLDCLQMRKKENVKLGPVKLNFVSDKDVVGSSLVLRQLVMGQYDPFHTFTIHFSKIHCNITLLPSGLLQRYCISMTLCTGFNPSLSPASWRRCSHGLASLQANVSIAAYLKGLNLILPTYAAV